MAEQRSPDWPTCQVDDECIGVQLKDARDQGCLNHTTDDTARERWWAEIWQGGPLDARGLSFTSEQLDQLLLTTPRNEQNRPQLTEPDFSGATFESHAGFDEATFTGDAGFIGATFTGNAGFDGATFESDARFDGATFTGAAVFRGATFTGNAGFDGATFESDARFDRTAFKSLAWFGTATFTGDAGFIGATFTGDAGFIRATFEGAARFGGATFEGEAWFEGATFTGNAGFDGATFESPAGFGGATFEDHAGFGRATFTGAAAFIGATFTGTAGFIRATFEGAARFDRATFTGDARFAGATFTGNAQLGPMLVRSRMSLTGATFAERLDLEIAATRLDCTRSRFAGGGRVRVAGGDIDLTEAEIPEPCILEDGADRLRADEGLWQRMDASQLRADMSRTVRLSSLQGATVTGLVLGTVDLRGCRFDGAHSLDRVRVPHTAQLHHAPPAAAFRRLQAALRPVVARRQRRVLAEEITWRQAQRVRLRWAHRDWQSLQTGEATDPATTRTSGLEATDIAELYRALRAGREARGDEPGAADFYYGEMEMRRKSASASWAERRILDLYWLLSGYALRASRAVIAFFLVAFLGWGILSLWGYQDQPTVHQASLSGQVGTDPLEAHLKVPTPSQADWRDAGWASFESMLFRAPPNAEALTTFGRFTTNALRVVGPVLVALAVLSVRGRAKR